MPESIDVRVQSAIERLRAWCEKSGASAVVNAMQPPASDQQLDDLELKLNVKMSRDLRALYKIANGQSQAHGADPSLAADNEVGMFPSVESFDQAFLLASTEKLKTDELQDIFDPGYVWEDSWIPFGINNVGDALVCDLAEGSPMAGRVLQFNHELAAVYQRADSVMILLEQIADAAESGELLYDADHGLIPAEEFALDFNTLHENEQLEFHNPLDFDD
ncbi:MAG: SMI1/KNR4 family protein [Planctomycetota bacterium]